MNPRNETRPHVLNFCGEKVVFDPAVVEPPPLKERVYPVTSLALDVSGSCNMKCLYCAESSTMPKRPCMSQSVLERTVDLLFEWSSHNRLSLHVGSGEPLLQPDAVHKIGEKARALQNHRDVTLHITTNGTLLTDSICTWLIEDQWRIKISLDGPASIHDQFRKDQTQRGTFRRIEPFVRKLAQVPNFSTTSVFCHGTDPAEVFYSIAALGVHNIEIVPVAIQSSPLMLTHRDIETYRNFVTDYVRRIAQGESLPWLTRLIKKVQRVMGYNNSRIPCGAGRTFLAAGPQGNLYPCFRFVGLDDYLLGDIISGPSPEKLKEFSLTAGRPYDKREKCSTCWAAPLCCGPCFACADLIFPEGEPSPEYCDMILTDCRAAVWLTHTLQKKNPESLVKLLGVRPEDV